MRVVATRSLLMAAAFMAYSPVQALSGPGDMPGGRAVPADPEAATERLAAASNRAVRGGGHDRPSGSVRNIIRTDHSAVSQAYAWLDNK